MKTDTMTLTPAPSGSRFPEQLAGGFLLLLLAANLPGFLCMPLDIDTHTFDLYLRGMQEGRILYEDMVENNLPGAIWVHGVTRSLLGWSSEALRLVDLLIIGSAIGLMCAWQRGMSLAGRLWMASFLFSCYFSTTEWTHCQRDPWTLLPAMACLHLRRRQVERLAAGRRTTAAAAGFGVLEGVVWGVAVWIKPYVFVPAALVWLVSLLAARRQGVRPLESAADTLGLLVGGALCGLLGVLWMKAHHCWEPYLRHMQNLRQFYYAADMYYPFAIGDYRLLQLLTFHPWSLIGVGSLAFAGVYWLRGTCSPRLAGGQGLGPMLFASLFVGYAIESLLMQHVFDYAVMPTLLVALAWVAMWAGNSRVESERLWLGVLLFLAAFVGHLPHLKHRVHLWERCVREGATWELKEQLMILERTSWVDLRRVAEYLRSRGVRDGELTVFIEGGIPLYEELGVRPTTKSYMMTNQIISLPYRRPLIFEELRASKQRFVFTSNLFMKRDREDLEELPSKGDQPLPHYWTHGSRDWSKFVVFRSGLYMILELPPELMDDWSRECLGL